MKCYYVKNKKINLQYTDIILLPLFDMAKDSDKDKEQEKINLEKKTDRQDDGDVIDKESSEQPEEEEIEEHPEH